MNILARFSFELHCCIDRKNAGKSNQRKSKLEETTHYAFQTYYGIFKWNIHGPILTRWILLSNVLSEYITIENGWFFFNCCGCNDRIRPTYITTTSSAEETQAANNDRTNPTFLYLHIPMGFGQILWHHGKCNLPCVFSIIKSSREVSSWGTR